MFKLLTYTTLYPNRSQPRHGIFVEQRLRRLVESGRVVSRVVAPVPLFPFKCLGSSRYSVYTDVPTREKRHGLEIVHPRYPVIPKIGMSIAPVLLAASSYRSVLSMYGHRDDIDIIDAHYLYPDGVAAAMLARRLGKPLVITARGTDVNLIPEYRIPRKWILWAVRQASAIITVCQALKDRLVDLGVPPQHVVVLRNGVDLDLFTPTDRDRIRKELGLTRPTLISVGHLIRRKGHDLAIQALAHLPETDLLIVGGGGEEAGLRKLAAEMRLGDRVRFIGEVPHTELKNYYSAADLLILASDREGWPNVLLESMACGTPVVATRVWGTPEVVQERVAGLLADSRSAQAIAECARDLLAHRPDRGETRRYAEHFSWNATTQGQIELFGRILGRAQS